MDLKKESRTEMRMADVHLGSTVEGGVERERILLQWQDFIHTLYYTTRLAGAENIIALGCDFGSFVSAHCTEVPHPIANAVFDISHLPQQPNVEPFHRGWNVKTGRE